MTDYADPFKRYYLSIKMEVLIVDGYCRVQIVWRLVLLLDENCHLDAMFEHTLVIQ
jgi:hypothetical protein